MENGFAVRCHHRHLDRTHAKPGPELARVDQVPADLVGGDSHRAIRLGICSPCRQVDANEKVLKRGIGLQPAVVEYASSPRLTQNQS